MKHSLLSIAKGYKEMSEINAEMAEFCFMAENEVMDREDAYCEMDTESGEGNSECG